MTHLLTKPEAKRLASLLDEDYEVTSDAVDALLEKAWRRALGLERYMVVRLSKPAVVREIQVQHYCAFESSTGICVELAGPKLLSNGEIGKVRHAECVRVGTQIKRRMLDGSWIDLGTFTGVVQQ